MQPTLIKQPFHLDGWVYEEKIERDGRVHHGGARRKKPADRDEHRYENGGAVT